MKNIHFIINPIAGSGKHNITVDFLKQKFTEDEYLIKVKYSKQKKHAIELTMESIKENAHIVVACGGDGTINEVASCLIKTPVILGIIPVGSGNGLASNLNIPKNIDQAISLIKNNSVSKIDVGSLNDRYFFSNTGVGFDADVIKNYEALKGRTLFNYVRACLKSFLNLNKNSIDEICIDDGQTIKNPFMIFISNSNELGYNISLTPKASLQDGLLDVMVVARISKLKILLFGLLVLFKKHHLLSDVNSFQTKNIKLYKKHDQGTGYQLDGEFYSGDEGVISISICEKSINVIS